MTNTITLLQRAISDIKIVELILKENSEDEVQLDVAAYHVQQAIEKCMKFNIQQAGEVFPRTHDVYLLVQQLEHAGLAAPEWIYNNGDTINSYATKTRYGTSIVSTRKKIQELCELTSKYIEDSKPLLSEEEKGIKPLDLLED